jgi:hypothetical protein
VGLLVRFCRFFVPHSSGDCSQFGVLIDERFGKSGRFMASPQLFSRDSMDFIRSTLVSYKDQVEGSIPSAPTPRDIQNTKTGSRCYRQHAWLLTRSVKVQVGHRPARMPGGPVPLTTRRHAVVVQRRGLRTGHRRAALVMRRRGFESGHRGLRGPVLLVFEVAQWPSGRWAINKCASGRAAILQSWRTVFGSGHRPAGMPVSR